MFKKKMKQIGAMAMAASMILASVQLPPLAANAAENTNLALSATATASNSEGGNEIAKINDGNMNTRWSHDQSNTSWAQLAWAESKTMKSFVINWQRNNAVNYTLQVSDDGQTWRNVYTATQAPATTTDKITLDTAVTGKFLRLNVTKIEPTNAGVTWNAISVWELQVYEGDIPDTRTQAAKIADSMTAPTVTADTTKIPMPTVPEGYTVEFDADYEQIIGSDGTVYKPLQTKTVKGFYQISNADGTDKAQSAEFTITVPGRYTDAEGANVKPDVIPALQEWHGETGDFVIQSSSKIVYADGLEATAKQFAEDYKDITGNDIQTVKVAGLLHDIGKIGIPDNILNRPTRLTEEEFQVIKEHTVIGAEILKNITLIDHVKEVARSHHERYDGMGYPDGLKGEEIPLYARVIAIADCYDAMKSRRIYRNPLGDEVIYNEISRNCGSQFAPKIAGVFLKMLNEGRVVIREDGKLADKEDNLLNMEAEIEKFISTVMITMKTQEDSEGFDFLTGLPMRNRGEKLAAQFMQQDSGYLVFLDMDNLKKMNDLYGHKAGDRALKLLGSFLMEYAHHSVVCRLGGDEFLMFVPNVSKEKITEIVTEIQEKFEQSKEKDVAIRCASVSAGICEVNKGDPFEECYSKADKALYYVKQNGKGSFFFYQQMEGEKIVGYGTGKDLTLVSKALSASGDYSGALELDYREFAKIYEYMNSMEKRYKCHCYLVMVTLETEADSVLNIEDIEYALECMEQAIRQKIRKVDVCTRYSSMQYLIILFEPDEKTIPNIMERIFGQYREQCGKKKLLLNYEYMSMTEK